MVGCHPQWRRNVGVRSTRMRDVELAVPHHQRNPIVTLRATETLAKVTPILDREAPLPPGAAPGPVWAWC